MTCILSRKVPLRSSDMLAQQGVHPLLARLYAARGVQDRSQIDYSLKASADEAMSAFMCLLLQALEPAN